MKILKTHGDGFIEIRFHDLSLIHLPLRMLPGLLPLRKNVLILLGLWQNGLSIRDRADELTRKLTLPLRNFKYIKS